MKTRPTRRNQRSTLAVLAFLSCLLFAATTAHAQAQLSGQPLEAVLVRNADRLGLDAETVSKIKQLSEESYAQMVKIQEEMQPAAKAFAEVIQSEKPDEAEAMRLLEELGAHELEGRKARLHAMLQFRSMLSPEQLEELAVIEKEMMKAAHRGGPRPPAAPTPPGPAPSPAPATP